MGIILDSSILIAAERGGEGVGQILKRVRAAHGETEAGLSAVAIQVAKHYGVLGNAYVIQAGGNTPGHRDHHSDDHDQLIGINPEQVIGMPRNTDRHRPESPLYRDLAPRTFQNDNP